MTSPTQRSLAKLRGEGWTVRITEHWNQYARIRQDLFGFGDLIAVKVGVPGATLVQTTSGSNVAARVEKIKGIAEAGIWLAAGNRIVVHGWRKVGERGKRKVWECREVKMTGEVAFAGTASVARPCGGMEVEAGNSANVILIGSEEAK